MIDRQFAELCGSLNLAENVNFSDFLELYGYLLLVVIILR